MVNDTSPKPGPVPQRFLSIGFWLFVAGIATAAYCGYHERYGEGYAIVWLKLGGWTLMLLGLSLYLLGLFQSPIRRR